MIQFKHIRTRIAVVFLTSTAVLQLAGLLPLGYTLDRHATKIAENQIEISERIFVNLLQHNTQNYKQAAQILTADYAFREAIASADEETIRSALSNYQARIHSQVAYYFSLDGSVQVSNAMTSSGMRKINAQMAAYHYKSGALQFEIIDNQPFQLITVPVKAPALVGWIVLGFKIDHQLSSQIKQLTNLDVTFIDKTTTGWKLIDTTLPASLGQQLLQTMSGIYQKQMSLQSIQQGDNQYFLKTRALHEKNGELILVVLQGSVTKFVNELDTLFNSMILLTIIGLLLFALVAWYLSRVTVQPITDLLRSAREITEGNFSQFIELKRSDELGQLGNAFNVMVKAILERKERIKKLAFTDSLTGQANRLSFMQSLQEAIGAHALTKQPFSVLVLNIDRFKPVNSVLGRGFGDELLRIMGKQLARQVTSPRDVVARLDADEFAVILHETVQTGATQYADKIRQWLESPVHVLGQPIDVRVGIGIAMFPAHGENEETLLHHAETAQQACKDKKAGWIVYSSALDTDQSASLSMISALKQAAMNDEMLLYVQPKVDIHSRKVLGAEALVRWVHPEKGMIFPDQFIPFAEQTGVISKVTQWMLEKACAELAALKQQGIRVSMAVNLSTRDLNNSHLPDQIAALLARHGLTSEMLKLEITESSLMQDPERAQLVLRKLSGMGLHMAIDDFGTGYSSMSYLRHLPVHELKIDKSFVMFMDKNPGDLAIVKSTIDLAHNLGLKVVAEGIENEDVMHKLDKLGCNEGQGYFIGKPMPVHDFAIWLERWEGQQLVTLDIGDNVLTTDEPALGHLDFTLNS